MSIFRMIIGSYIKFRLKMPNYSINIEYVTVYIQKLDVVIRQIK